ncbi:hypothetical protein AMS68_004959 [Peltaster fructicola]|uniref:Uncharacterized protein n=1 Tax=Peltaster fructicola TaxID=286661 RepID=A0A6H0XXE2_9PEZI|nr:hypothetical protein AMS68_004959 [Peltaster fructicola]
MANDRYYSRVPSSGSFDTAYTGADCYIDYSSLEKENLEDHTVSLEALQTPKPALSSRLLSSLPRQPAAAAALTRSKSILHSRAKSLAAWTSSFTPAVTPTSGKEHITTNRLFGDLFSGESAPVRLGIPPTSPIKEDTEFVMDYRPSLTQRSSFASRRKSAVLQASQPVAKQSWFSRKNAEPAAPPVPAVDELLTLNINNSLFPNGPVDDFSPSDFNSLLLNATKLLERMQTAYREKVEYIATIQPELDAQREEAEEAETRAQHLKMQLEDMARRADEQQTAMSKLEIQLSEGRPGSIRVVDDDNDNTRQRRKRSSAASASDSGFESDWDRDTESVVSSGIPTPRTPPALMAGSPFDNLDQRLYDRRLGLQRQAPLRAKGIDDSSTAWHTVQHLRNENQDLRGQLKSMQQTLQGCIDFVDTVHM